MDRPSRRIRSRLSDALIGQASPAALSDPRLQALLTYWHEKRGQALMPPRTAIDPLEMPRAVLPYLMLTEVVERGVPRRYRYRLFGTEMVRAAKADMTWKFLDEVVPVKDGYRDYVLGLYEGVIQEKRPLYSTGDYVALGAPDTPERSTQRLMLPLGADKGSVTHILAGQIFFLHGAHDGSLMHSATSFREQMHSFLHID